MKEKKDNADSGVRKVLETRTKGGQLLTVTCDYKKADAIKRILSQIEGLEIEEVKTKRVLISHGAYGAYTRYSVKQHKYAGGGYAGCGGYIEVLEICNPPDNRCGTVIHMSDSSHGNRVFEFTSLKSAKRASSYSQPEDICKQPGFIREFECGILQPWFFAVGDQHLFGDYVFPDSVAEQSLIYQLGRKFVLKDEKNRIVIKTCIGSWHREEEGLYEEDKKKYLFIQWTDGTRWSEYNGKEKPKPLDELDPELAWILERKTGRFDEQLLLLDKKKFTIFLPGRRKARGVITITPCW